MGVRRSVAGGLRALRAFLAESPTPCRRFLHRYIQDPSCCPSRRSPGEKERGKPGEMWPAPCPYDFAALEREKPSSNRRRGRWTLGLASRLWVGLLFGLCSALALGWGSLDKMVESEWDQRRGPSKTQAELAEVWLGRCEEMARVAGVEAAGGCLTLEQLLKSIAGGGTSAMRLDSLAGGFGDGQEASRPGGFIPEVVHLKAEQLDLPLKGATIPTAVHMDPEVTRRWEDGASLRQETAHETEAALLASRGEWRKILCRLRACELLDGLPLSAITRAAWRRTCCVSSAAEELQCPTFEGVL